MNMEKNKNEIKFTKKNILKSKKYQNRKDILNVLLEDKEYSFSEVDALIDKFMKGKVS